MSAIVCPRSEPATNAPYTGAGNRFRARRWATATDSNHGFCFQGFCNQLGFGMRPFRWVKARSIICTEAVPVVG